ncbi:hypothetical protein C8R44DRAFT_893963 [Mycena epipterygia]|nr:hypothetical protein C8R44DRAFT_893963 [Mycena epipterygia]
MFSRFSTWGGLERGPDPRWMLKVRTTRRPVSSEIHSLMGSLGNFGGMTWRRVLPKGLEVGGELTEPAQPLRERAVVVASEKHAEVRPAIAFEKARRLQLHLIASTPRVASHSSLIHRAHRQDRSGTRTVCVATQYPRPTHALTQALPGRVSSTLAPGSRLLGLPAHATPASPLPSLPPPRSSRRRIVVRSLTAMRATWRRRAGTHITHLPLRAWYRCACGAFWDADVQVENGSSSVAVMQLGVDLGRRARRVWRESARRRRGVTTEEMVRRTVGLPR